MFEFLLLYISQLLHWLTSGFVELFCGLTGQFVTKGVFILLWDSVLIRIVFTSRGEEVP